jgi:hypothetical protein
VQPLVDDNPVLVVVFNMITECAEGPCRAYPIKKACLFVWLFVCLFVKWLF